MQSWQRDKQASLRGYSLVRAVAATQACWISLYTHAFLLLPSAPHSRQCWRCLLLFVFVLCNAYRVMRSHVCDCARRVCTPWLVHMVDTVRMLFLSSVLADECGEAVMPQRSEPLSCVRCY